MAGTVHVVATAAVRQAMGAGDEDEAVVVGAVGA